MLPESVNPSILSGQVKQEDQTANPSLQKDFLRGAAWALAFGGILFSTLLIPRLWRISAVFVQDARSGGLPTVSQLRSLAGAPRLHLTNYWHRSVSAGGLLFDQLYRCQIAFGFLVFYCIRTMVSQAVMRRVIGIFSILGAAACLSDVISYWVLGGVADWIGIGAAAVAPTDMLAGLSPVVIAVAAVGGLTWTRLQRMSRRCPD